MSSLYLVWLPKQLSLFFSFLIGVSSYIIPDVFSASATDNKLQVLKLYYKLRSSFCTLFIFHNVFMTLIDFGITILGRMFWLSKSKIQF